MIGGLAAMYEGRSTTDRERWGLRGPVRACTLRRTWFACGDGACGTDKRGDTGHVEFRPDGALTLHRHQNPDGSAWESMREYDSSGRLVAARTGGPGGVTNVSMYEYDAQGRLERVVAREPDGRERVAETYQYSADGSKQKTEELNMPEACGGAFSVAVEGTGVGYSADGATTIVVRYDQRGQPVETAFMGRDGQVLSRVSATYDERGRLVEETQTVIEVALPEAIRTQLPASDVERLQAMLGGGRVNTHRLHRYDDDGHCIETRSSHFGGLGQHRQTFGYNERGDQILEIRESNQYEGELDDRAHPVADPASLTSHRSETRFQYDYDAEGNWVKKVVESRPGSNQEFSVSTIETRDIQYYPAP